MNNITHVSDSLMCSTCGACAAVCPKDVISFSMSSTGRMYASVGDRCVDCGFCRRVCPSESVENTTVGQYNAGVVSGVFVGRSTNSRYYGNAQSGGVCTTLVDYLLKSGKIDGALMVRMKYGKTPVVEAFVADRNTDLTLSQKSCYTPVPLLAALKQCKEKESIAVVGLPCQMKAITAMQALKKFGNVRYKIGLLCEGVLGMTAQDALISFSNPKMSDNQKIDWKRKTVPTTSGGGIFQLLQ